MKRSLGALLFVAHKAYFVSQVQPQDETERAMLDKRSSRLCNMIYKRITKVQDKELKRNLLTLYGQIEEELVEVVQGVLRQARLAGEYEVEVDFTKFVDLMLRWNELVKS